VILIVDHNDEVRSVTAQRLSALGYCPLEAKSVSRAIAQLKMPDIKIALVITDDAMPGAMDGLGLAGWVKENVPAAKVMLTSAHVTVQAGNQPKDASTHLRILSKPYPMDELARALRDEFDAKEQIPALNVRLCGQEIPSVQGAVVANLSAGLSSVS
jgi:DNA-binding NtrC family response regulator